MATYSGFYNSAHEAVIDNEYPSSAQYAILSFFFNHFIVNTDNLSMLLALPQTPSRTNYPNLNPTITTTPRTP